jgi:mono/diheme cytochrome c family protein
MKTNMSMSHRRLSLSLAGFSALLWSVPGSPGTDSPPGAAAFARVCAACHGAQGEGDKGPPIVPLAYMEDQVAVVVRGGQGQMPPIPKAALSDQELADILAYLSQLEP